MSVQEPITEHLDLWTSATTHSSTGRGKNGKVELTGVQKLRELILELAIRGKLDQSDPNDQPAEQQYEEITTAKNRLIQKGHINKPRELPPITETERSFTVPQGWTWVRLGNLLRVINGRAYKKHEMLDHGTPLLRVGNLFTSNTWYYSDLHLEDDKYIESGDLIYAWSASFGPFMWKGQRAIYHYHIWKLDLFDETAVDKLFIYYYLNAITEQIKSSGNGIAMIHMTKSKMEELPLPLPPKAEQQRIVQKVDELMALCDRLEQQTSDQLEVHETLVDTLLNTLTQSENATELADNWARLAAHFDTLFRTEQSINKLKKTALELACDGRLVQFEAEMFRLKNILSFGPRNGQSPKESKILTGYRALKLGATTKGNLDIQESKDVEVDIPEKSHLWLKKDDILIQRGNAASHVGCNVLVEEDHRNYIYPDLMMKVRVKETVDPKFISLYLSAPKSRQFMWERMTGTSGTMPKISKKVVEEIPVALPDINTQYAVVDKIDEITALCDTLKQRLHQVSETRCQMAQSVVEGALN